MYRVGNGFDVHKFIKGKKLIIGGVAIDYEFGLEAHSDGDVLLHAICDALLGAVSEKDIGFHFPDADKKWKNVSSLELLKNVYELIKTKGFVINNIDSIIIAEEPKISPYIDFMRNKIAKALNTNIDCVSVKATTTERLGFTGRKEGIASQAVVMLRKTDE